MKGEPSPGQPEGGGKDDRKARVEKGAANMLAKLNAAQELQQAKREAEIVKSTAAAILKRFTDQAEFIKEEMEHLTLQRQMIEARIDQARKHRSDLLDIIASTERRYEKGDAPK